MERLYQSRNFILFYCIYAYIYLQAQGLSGLNMIFRYFPNKSSFLYKCYTVTRVSEFLRKRCNCSANSWRRSIHLHFLFYSLRLGSRRRADGRDFCTSWGFFINCAIWISWATEMLVLSCLQIWSQRNKHWILQSSIVPCKMQTASVPANFRVLSGSVIDSVTAQEKKEK